MISTFTAFFDSNVFYGARLRSLVMFAAQTKLFRARWTDAVHDEWIENLLAKRVDLKSEDLAATRELMNAAVPDCLVEGYEPLIAGLTLPDPDDRHVLAAAIQTRANVIVTFNLSDFPQETLAGFRLHAKHPDAFLCDAFSLAPSIFAEAVRLDFQHYVAPKLDYDDYLDALAKSGIEQLAEQLRPLKVIMQNGAP